MALLPSTSVVSYGTFTFPVEHSTTVSISPTYDPAERTVIWDTYQVIIDTDLVTSQFFNVVGVGTTVAPAQTTATGLDSVLAAIQVQLSRPGDSFVMTGKGLSDISIPAIQRDVKWGPKPRLLQWQPLASNQACHLRWQVEFCILRCDNESNLAITHLNYTPTFSVDKNGYVTQVVNGTFSIRMSRANVNARNIPDSADNYIDAVIANFPTPTNFQRTSTQRTISLDKRECNFTITDAQIPVVLPAGVTEIDMHYTVHNDTKSLFTFFSTLSGKFTLRGDVLKKNAFGIFIAEFYKRVKIQTDSKRLNGPILLISYSFDENLYGADIGRIALTWRSVYQTKFEGSPYTKFDLRGLFPAAALWRPIDNSYTAWAASMKPIWRPGGLANIKDNASGDMIIDLCGESSTAEMRPKTQLRSSLGLPFGFTVSGTPFTSSDPTVLYARSSIRIAASTNVIMHKPLPKFDVATSSGSSGALPFQGIERAQGSSTLALTAFAAAQALSAGAIPDLGRAMAGTAEAFALSQKFPDIVQQRVSPTGTFWLSGAAARAGFPVPLPTIRSFGGAPVVQLGGSFQQEQVANWGGVPIFAASWNFLYAETKLPTGKVPVPENLSIQLPERKS